MKYVFSKMRQFVFYWCILTNIILRACEDNLFNRTKLVIFVTLSLTSELRRKIALLDKVYGIIAGRTYCSVEGVKYKLVDHDCLNVIAPRFEWWMWRYLRPRRGDVFIDVGVHIGKYSLRAAKMVGGSGEVVAIEPSPENFEALTKGILLNKLANIVPINVAAWCNNTKLSLFLHEHSGGNSIKAKSSFYVRVKAQTLDDIVRELNLERIDWVKIDAEGSEYEILLGFAENIKRYRPRVAVEIKEENKMKVIQLLDELGYDVQPVKEDLSKEYFYCEPKRQPFA